MDVPLLHAATTTFLEELEPLLQNAGRNIGSWEESSSLEELVEQGYAALLPVEEYQQWCAQLPQEQQLDVIQYYGPPPGDWMVYEEQGKQLEFSREYFGMLIVNHELEALLRGLAGGFIIPRVGGDPLRSPTILPTGHNMIFVDPTTIPTPVAWEVGKRLTAQ